MVSNYPSIFIHCNMQSFVVNCIFWFFKKKPNISGELQMNPMPFHLDSPWGATLMPLRACAINWRQNRILRVGKTSSPYFEQFVDRSSWNFGRCRGPFVLSNALARLSLWCFIQKIFSIKSYLKSSKNWT